LSPPVESSPALTPATPPVARPDGRCKLQPVRESANFSLCRAPLAETSSGRITGVTSYGGGASWSHELLDGTFNASINATENTADTGSTVSNNRRKLPGVFDDGKLLQPDSGWHVSGSFGYAQNVQTLLVTYMNSFL